MLPEGSNGTFADHYRAKQITREGKDFCDTVCPMNHYCRLVAYIICLMDRCRILGLNRPPLVIDPITSIKHTR